MASLYTLKILADFASAHTLRNYPGDCSRMHGHNWKLEVEVIATGLDEMGMGVDFKVIKTAARDLAKTLDHRYLNDIPPFNTLNPTAENIAAYFYRNLSRTLNDARVRVSAVTLWETERACVRYSEAIHGEDPCSEEARGESQARQTNAAGRFQDAARTVSPSTSKESAA